MNRRSMFDRWPAIAAIALCLTALVIADQTPREENMLVEAAPPELMPVASSADSLGSSWYCAGGLVTVEESLDHVVIITNPNPVAATGQLTLYPSVPDGFGASEPGDVIVQPFDISGGAQTRIALGALIPQDAIYVNAIEIYVGALLEFDQPGVLVEHALVTARGTDVGPCASTAAESWHLASGTTSTNVRDMVAILNPFPGSAAVDIWFPTDTGVRRPTAFTGLVLPPESVTLLDVRNQVSTRTQMAMTVETRSGRVVVERMQLFSDADGPEGATLTLGAPSPARQWFFPAGRAEAGYAESYVIYNPSEVNADVVLGVLFDDREAFAIDQPLTVGAGQRSMVTFDTAENHPVAEIGIIALENELPETGGYSVSVRSFNEAQIVVERITTNQAPGGLGATAVMGAPLASTAQYVAIPVNEVLNSSPQLTIFNPAGDTLTTATAWALVAGERVELLQVELGPLRRAVADLSETLPPGAIAIEVEATQGVIIELNVHGAEGAVAAMGIPVIDQASEPRYTLGN